MRLPYDRLSLLPSLDGRSEDFGTRSPASSNVTASATSNADSDASHGNLIAGIVIAVVLVVLLASFLVLRSLRISYENPRFVPGQYLKKRWEAWTPHRIVTSNGSYSSRLQDDQSAQSLASRNNASRSAMTSRSNLATTQQQSETSSPLSAAEVVERHTSVRSVMTLPAYSRSVRENERVLGREGDRDGIDVVVEAPETEEQEETRRDEEMEGLYQIRVQRRQEIASREDRRQRRRAARDRGDLAEIERIRLESMRAINRRDVDGVAALVAAHQARVKDRRVGSVSYADVGVARHDGTRVRASCDEAERPLLDSAASFGGSASLRPWTTRDDSRSGSAHRRANASVTSFSDTSSAEAVDITEMPTGGLPLPITDVEIVNLNNSTRSLRSRADSSSVNIQTRSRATSNVRPSVDTGRSRGDSHASEQRLIPNEEPPSYDGEGFEEAPPYESPIAAHAPQLPPIDRQTSTIRRVTGGPTASPQMEPSLSSNTAESVPPVSPISEPDRQPNIDIAITSPTDSVPPLLYTSSETDIPSNHPTTGTVPERVVSPVSSRPLAERQEDQ